MLNEKTIKHYVKNLSPYLEQFIKDEKLDGDFLGPLSDVYLPLANWINSKHNNSAIVIGINGAQGSGKSTLCRLLSLILDVCFNKTVLNLSLDDLYLSKESRLQLSKTIHPLLSVRGVPGTHDTALAIELFKKLKSPHITPSNIKAPNIIPLAIPIFDKSIDDILPKEKWHKQTKPVDIILFEGWCVGAKAQHESELMIAINELEREQDKTATWRHYINQKLKIEYAQLFSFIDHLIMLKVPDMQSVYTWRLLQEKKLSKSAGEKNTMDEESIKAFIMYFERLTLHCLEEMPKRVDLLLTLDKNHKPSF